MVKGKRKEALWFFAAIIVVYVVLLSYLLFFNSGLELTQRTTASGEPIIFIENSSIHLIRDATVSVFAEGKTIKELRFEELLPEEREEISLKGIFAPQVLLVAEAPFHLTARKQINMRKGAVVSLQPEIIAAKVVGTGNPLELKLGLCNQGSGNLESIMVEERHSLDFFEEIKRIDSLSLPAGKCSALEYVLTAKQTGKALIIFNISALNYSEKITWEVEII